MVDLRAMAQSTPSFSAEKINKNEAPREIHWQAEEFTYHHKDSQWFIAAGIAAAGLIISLLIMKNIFGAATILLFFVIIYLYATKKPNVISAAIDAKGVTVKQKLIPYSTIASFWILYEPPIKELILIRKEHLTPKIIIPIGDANPVEIRNVLLANAVKEKEEEESLAEIIARRLRF